MDEGKILKFPGIPEEPENSSSHESGRVFKIGRKGRERDPRNAIFTEQEIQETERQRKIKVLIDEIRSAVGQLEPRSAAHMKAFYETFHEGLLDQPHEIHELIEFALKSTAEHWRKKPGKFAAIALLLEEYLREQLKSGPSDKQA
jgi:hypothetical protein